MNLAIIGTGKTGQYLDPHHPQSVTRKEDRVFTFNSRRPVTLEKLQEVDVVIVFVPGSAAISLLPLLLQANKPCVFGSTGQSWPDDLDQVLKQQGLSWIWAHNFGLGMVVIRHLFQELHRLLRIFPASPQLQLREIHHIHKKDAPSGTALSWKEWLNLDVPIKSVREGDVIGIHELSINAGAEIITINHTATDRSLFAQGAYWAASVLAQQKIPPGFHSFQEITELVLQNK